MRVGLITTCFSAVLLTASAAWAGNVAPGDVKLSDGEIASSLTETAGDPATGKQVFADRKLGNCLACHENADQSDLPFHGEVGPSLEGVADRWEDSQLRAIVVNAKAVFGDETLMPAFYGAKDGNRVAKKSRD